MKKGFTLIELMIVIAIIAIIAAIAIPGLLAAQRASNERNASASLKTITTAQADFRSNDRDGNLVNDYWTADVFALYGLIPLTNAGGGVLVMPAASPSTAGIIKLIEPSVAGADGLSQVTAGAYGSVTVAASIINGSPKAGYIYRAFASQDDGGGPTTLRVDTDGGPYGTVHDRNRFAFAAMPETLSAGKLMYIVNADNTIYKYNLPAGYILAYTPLIAGTDSSSNVTGSTGVAAATGNFDFTAAAAGSGVFPQAPGAFGCSKMD